MGRFASPARNWRVVWSRQLDTRTPLEKRFADCELAGLVGRTRPAIFGPRTPHVMKEIVAACGALPWEIPDDQN